MISLLILLFSFTTEVFASPRSTVVQKSAVSKIEKAQPRHNIYIEALGRGGIYSIGYEYQASRRSNFGIGYSFQSAKLNPTAVEGQVQFHTLPVYSTLYFPWGPHRPFISAGATAVYVKTTADFKFNDIIQQFSVVAQKNDEASDVYTADVNVPDSKNVAEIFLAIPHVSAGYEYRMNSGSFGRIHTLTFIADKPLIWLGVSFGVGF